MGHGANERIAASAVRDHDDNRFDVFEIVCRVLAGIMGSIGGVGIMRIVGIVGIMAIVAIENCLGDVIRGRVCRSIPVDQPRQTVSKPFVHRSPLFAQLAAVAKVEG